MKKKRHFIVFDSAYMGFGSDNYHEDVFSLRQFANEYNNIILCQSFSKNFGLYGERVGCLSLVCESKFQRDIVTSKLKDLVLPLYATPPLHGARIVNTILKDSELRSLWEGELLAMSQRIRACR